MAKKPLLGLEPKARRVAESRFLRDVRKLNEQVERRVAAGEAVDQIMAWFGPEFAYLVLEKHQRLFDVAPGPAKMGRPRAVRPAPARPPGKPTTFTPEVEAKFLADIDRRKRALAKAGRRSSDSAALRWAITSYFVGVYEGEGMSHPDAIKAAQAKARSALFTTRKSQLARLRRRGQS